MDTSIAVVYCLIAGAGVCVVRRFGPFSLSSYRVEDDYDEESSKENICYRILAPSLFCIVAVLAANGLAGLLFGEFGTLASFAPTIMYWVMLSVRGRGLKVGPSSDGRIGVRMYDVARIEEALVALFLGFSASQAAELAGGGSPPRWSRGGGMGCCLAAGTALAGVLGSGRRRPAERWSAWLRPEARTTRRRAVRSPA